MQNVGYNIIAVQVLLDFYNTKAFAGGGTKYRKRIIKSVKLIFALHFIPGLLIQFYFWYDRVAVFVICILLGRTPTLHFAGHFDI